MRHLFLIDPPERLAPRADTSIAFMREAARRGHEIWQTQLEDFGARDGGRPFAGAATSVELRPGDDWYRLGEARGRFLDEFDVVWMRKDPPFDLRYVYATHLLSLVRRPTLVVNDPQALRDDNEKLVTLRFPDLIPETLISSRMSELLAFRDRLGGEMIVKPLGGAGGDGIFHLGDKDRNVRAILEMATRKETELLLAQRYLPEVRDGDKRVILVEGEPKGALMRVPHESESRANLHVGGAATKTTLTPRDLEICGRVGPPLRASGVVFAGLDIIGSYLTEVNITSPTGIREIETLDGSVIEKDVLDAVEARWRAGAAAARTR
ncbi:MAG TPA: glutathione synthase [Thermoanaerobaculia bacterium]|jgi:glutathione synthase|nr:glutathione synthase [Thermoanaerobaculia bacterium]